ncbi:SbcC/MukB-like Walker B domain-containing protein [Ralstonia pseudosolanacearum]|uniref:SbcC/MukB-like Walker B domain-containing protein n=1 Tax=Ralstonia pseudosolanacearum TaxID=1310165 RepID=UPI001FFAB06C|nr:SbcC/MukB-like Walker B domain-containing protein [Ralstonia pseudosolanacearum]
MLTDDTRNWVLGADTKAKVAALQDEADSLNEQLLDVRQQLQKLDERSRNQFKRVRACQTISDHRWQDIDFATPAQRARELMQQAQQLRDASPDLAAIDARIEVAKGLLAKAEEQHTEQAAHVLAITRQLEALDKEIERRAEQAFVTPTPLQRNALNERLEAAGRTPTLATLADDMRVVDRRLGNEMNALDGQLAELVRKIEDAFAAYNRGWPAESGGLDPKMASYDEYDAKLTRLQIDDLPRVEKKFKQLLNDQSNQHIALLANQIDQERRDISEKMDAVNRSLRNAEFNPNTYLVIEVEDRTPPEAKQFKADLRAALANTLSVDDKEAEARFQALKALIKRLASQQTPDVNWKTLALDVRLHVEFIARELREDDGSEVEVYRSGAGKSGGQRQKLTATCLAAALRYQLGGPGRLRPTFSTVFLDEAFDKADADFTEAAMKIFKMFGFQLIIATPIKSVMTIEPYVGGAVFVHIQDRKHSRVLVLPYDEEAQRIDYGALDGQDDATS